VPARELLPVVEITDLLWHYDPLTGGRVPVERAAVVTRLNASGQRRAARIVGRLANDGRYIDHAECDATLVRIHCELQRLGEELQLGRRIAATLTPWVRALREERPRLPVRIVDVGCGIGYAIRWLAAHRALGEGVELFGVDLNEALVGHDTRLAEAERLSCQFVAGDALAPGAAVGDGQQTIVISSGLVHHLSAKELPGFFAAQQRLGVAAFAHWDVDPSPWSTLGAWVFHRARMREPISRHDGVLSVRRAHTSATLLGAARSGAADYETRCTDAPRWRPRFTEVLRPITGSRPPI